MEGFLDPPGVWGSDALVDRKCLLQVRGGFAWVAVLAVAVADSFQGASFFQGNAKVAGDGQCLGVAVAGMTCVASPGG